MASWNGLLLAGAAGFAAGGIVAAASLTALAVLPEESSGRAVAAIPAPPPVPEIADPDPAVFRPAALTAAAPAEITDEATLTAVMLTRAAVLALNQANLTDDYDVLRKLGAPSFVERHTPDELSRAFKAVRETGADFAPVAVIDPVFVSPPHFDESGRLKLEGYFPSRPVELRFQLAFANVDSRWLLDDLAVQLAPVETANRAEPQPQPAAPPAP